MGNHGLLAPLLALQEWHHLLEGAAFFGLDRPQIPGLSSARFQEHEAWFLVTSILGMNVRHCGPRLAGAGGPSFFC